MLLMGLLWLRRRRNPELILCVVWEASVPVGQLLALQEISDVGWCDEGIIHHFLAVKSFLSSSKHSDKLQGQPSHASCSVCIHGKVAGSGRKPLISSLLAELRTCGDLCALPSHPLLDPQCGAWWSMETTVPFMKCFHVNELCYLQHKLFCGQ